MASLNVNADIDPIDSLEINFQGRTYPVRMDVASRAIMGLMDGTVKKEEVKAHLGIPQLTDFALEYLIAQVITNLPSIMAQLKKAEAAMMKISQSMSLLQADRFPTPDESIQATEGESSPPQTTEKREEICNLPG